MMIKGKYFMSPTSVTMVSPVASHTCTDRLCSGK